MLRRNLVLTAAGAMLSSQLAFADARVSVAHFAPFADTLEGTSVSVLLNDAVALENVVFKQFTPYLDLPAGDYKVDIVPTGTSTVAMTANYTLEDGKDYTVYASGNGSLQDLELVALVDDNTAPAMGMVKVRIIHAAPFGPTPESTEVSIRTAGGDLVAGLQGVPYGAGTDYLVLPENTYDLKVASNNGQVNYIDPLPVDLPSGAIVTLFAVGDIVNQDLSIIATPIAELPLRAPVDQTVSGAYKLDGFAGEGFFLTPIPSQNRLTGSWYTYNEDGSAQWFTFDSCLDDTEGCSTPGGFDGTSAITTLYQSTGATPGGDMQMTVPVGTIEFNVISCDLISTTVTVGNSEAFFDGVRLTPSALCPPPVATPVSN